MKIDVEFAILDVKGSKKAREDLRKLIEGGGRVNITLTGVIDGVHSQDDGTSREFTVSVTDIAAAIEEGV